MSSYTEALKIYNKYSSIDCSSLLYNIANIYFNCQMYDTSEKYYEQAILERQLKKPNEKMLLYHAYSKLSAAQIRQRKCKDALENLGKALKLAENGCGDALEILRQCAYVK
jgi:tetratricopeptide (TPR) repeat protein